MNITASSIVGKWKATNGEATAKVNMLENGRFSGTLYLNDILIWAYGGSWSVKDNYLTWVYEDSTPSLEEMGTVSPDVNRIVTVNENSLVLVEENGETSTYEKTIEATHQTGPLITVDLNSKPFRNSPCSCGSGKKYRHCCGALG